MDLTYALPPQFLWTTLEPQLITHALLSWTRQDELLMRLLISSLSHKHLPLVIDLNSSKKIWNPLNHHLSPSLKPQLHMEILLVPILFRFLSPPPLISSSLLQNTHYSFE